MNPKGKGVPYTFSPNINDKSRQISLISQTNGRFGEYFYIERIDSSKTIPPNNSSIDVQGTFIEQLQNIKQLRNDRKNSQGSCRSWGSEENYKNCSSNNSRIGEEDFVLCKGKSEKNLHSTSQLVKINTSPHSYQNNHTFQSTCSSYFSLRSIKSPEKSLHQMKTPSSQFHPSSAFSNTQYQSITENKKKTNFEKSLQEKKIIEVSVSSTSESQMLNSENFFRILDTTAQKQLHQNGALPLVRQHQHHLSATSIHTGNVKSTYSTLEQQQLSEKQQPSEPAHTYLQTKQTIKMMLFKEETEFCKLECKGKQLPMRMQCLKLTSPFEVAISSKDKFPDSNKNQYLLRFEKQCCKKVTFQFQKHLRTQSQNYNDKQYNKEPFQSDVKTDCIFFAFRADQFSNFEFSISFEDEITPIKYLSNKIAQNEGQTQETVQRSPQRVLKQQQDSTQSQIISQDKEAIMILRKRREETKKQSGNIVETNKINAKLFGEIEYQKFLDKVNKTQHIQRELVKTASVQKGEEQRQQILTKIEQRQEFRKRMQDVRIQQYKMILLKAFRQKWTGILALIRLVRNIEITIKKFNFASKFFLPHKIVTLKMEQVYRKSIQQSGLNDIQRLFLDVNHSCEFVAQFMKDSALIRAAEVVALTLQNKDTFPFIQQIFKRSQTFINKCNRIALFVRKQQSKEKIIVNQLLENIIRKMQFPKKSLSSSSSTTISQKTKSISNSYRIVSHLTNDTKKKLCKVFIEQKKRLFSKKYKQYCQQKMEQDQLAKRREEYQGQSPSSNRNWRSIQYLSMAISIFSGDQTVKANRSSNSSMNEYIQEDQQPAMTPLKKKHMSSIFQSQQIEQKQQILLQQQESLQAESQTPISIAAKGNNNFLSFHNAVAQYESTDSSKEQQINTLKSRNTPQFYYLQTGKQKTNGSRIFSPHNNRITVVPQKQPKLDLKDETELEKLFIGYLNGVSGVI